MSSFDQRNQRVDIQLNVAGDYHQAASAQTRIPLQKPRRVPRFTGRRRLIKEVMAALEPGHIVTLYGAGGIGKTSLASEAIWRMAPEDIPPDSFPDGIIYHSFYNQPQIDHMLEQIARIYGEEVHPNPLAAAGRALGGKYALLMLDGAENADNIYPLLDISGSCSLLITSRSVEDVFDRGFEIRPLQIDDSTALLTKWVPSVSIPYNLAREICQLVGGLPLAIELAGMHIELLHIEPESFLSMLRATPLRALDFGNRERRSVSILLEKSTNALASASKAVFALFGALSPSPIPNWFVNWYAKHTLSLSSNQTGRILHELTSLGLLRQNEDSFAVSHALVHSFASTRLGLSNAELKNLLDLFVAALEEPNTEPNIEFGLFRSHVFFILALLESRELWAEVHSLAFHVYKKYMSEGAYPLDNVQVSKAGLEAAKRMPDGSDEEMAWTHALGVAYLNQDQSDAAVNLLQNAIGLSQKMGEQRLVMSGNIHLAEAYRLGGQHELAEQHLQRALNQARNLNDLRGQCIALGNLGSLYSQGGDHSRAIVCYQQAILLWREMSDLAGLSGVLGNLGAHFSDRGDMEQAIEYYEEGLSVAREINDLLHQKQHLRNLGAAYSSLDMFERAVEYRMGALELARQTGDPKTEAECLTGLGIDYQSLGYFKRAEKCFEDALAINRSVGDRKAEAYNLVFLGTIHRDLGDKQMAKEYYSQALPILQAINSPKVNALLQLMKDLKKAVG